MRRAVLLAAAGAVLSAGCGSPDDEQGAAAPGLPELGPVVAAASVDAQPISDENVLISHLLSISDFPDGMTAVHDRRVNPGQAALTTVAETEPAECGRVMSSIAAQTPDPVTATGIAYSGPDFSSIDIDAATFAPDRVASAFTAVQEQLRRCTSYRGTDADEIAIEYRVGALDQPKAGDASASYQVRTTSEGLTLVSLVTVVQVGPTLAQVAVSAPEAVDPGLLSDLTDAQVRRLQGILGP